MNSASPSHVIVIGGGPSGLMAAESLAKAGIRTTIYDQMPTMGRKFLMAGRGGLNLTHSESLDKFLTRYGKASTWLAPAIEAFPPEALRAWCHDLGQETFVGSSGRVFPAGLKASPLLRAWLRRLGDMGVQVALRHSWRGWNDKSDLVFSDSEGRQHTPRADAVVLALGGASWPRLGSDGSWVKILQNEGVEMHPLHPANCGFIAPWSAIFAGRFAGQPLKPIKISFQETTLQGEAMITRDGLEGSVIYALSSALRREIETVGKAVISIDLHPGLSIEQIIIRLQAPRGSQSTSTYLRKATGLSPAALGLMRESLSGILPTDAEALAALIKETKITLTATSPIGRAISTAGGISHNAVTVDFMLKQKPGIFVAGEMLDWEAPTGGYLLQACFSTAVAAARGVKEYLKP